MCGGNNYNHMRFSRAYLTEPPSALVAGEDNLSSVRKEWIQDQGWWLLLVYRHRGTALVNAISHSFEVGTALLYPPGARGAHLNVGANTPHVYFHFKLPDDGTGPVALPIHSEFDASTVELCRQAAGRVTYRITPVNAFVWNLLWTISGDSRLIGRDDRLFDAEAYIERHLGEPLSVNDVCEAVGVPYRSLTRLFESEHGVAINRYIFRRRSREALRLLSETSLPLKAIAARVGVPDPHQFNKFIRKAIGISPTEVREQAANIGKRGFHD